MEKDFNTTPEATDIVHPGIILEQTLKDAGLSQKELSDAIGKSAPVINDIIKGKRNISPEIAYMLEAVIEGISAEEWLALQAHYDLARIKADQDIVKRKADIESWNQLKSLLNLGYLKKKIGLTGTVEENVANIYKYFNVTSVEALKKISTDTQAYFHKSSKHQTDPINLMTWMILVRKKSSDQTLSKAFTEESYDALVQELDLVFYKNEDTTTHTKETLNKYGIKYIEEEHLDKTPVDGYSFWDGANPTIAVTKRYNRIDNYAFAIMHELGHIVKHLSKDKSLNFVDSESPTGEDKKEKEANDFAVTALQRKENFEQLFKKWPNSFAVKGEIIRLSNTYQIHRSIIAGQFQHYKNSFAICRDLLDPIL